MDKTCFGGNNAMKLDIIKAFDTMRWDFIASIFLAFGFSSNFISQLLAIFHLAWISTFLNGSPTDYFSYSRCVYQGDLLLPFLFCIAEDFLIQSGVSTIQQCSILGIIGMRMGFLFIYLGVPLSKG